jgi:hypothetical protein
MSLLPIHIIAGVIGIISGFIAIFAVKGMRLHRKSGIVFVYSMVVLGLTGAVLGALKNEPGNVVAGALAAYFVVTALLTVRRGARDLRWLDAAAMIVALAISALSLQRAVLAFNAPGGHINGVPWGMSAFMGFVILLAAAGDLRVLLRGPLQGTSRISRHLWRMCFALFVASGSFFLGQAQVFPKPMRIYPLLAIPALLPLALLIYWLIRVRFSQWYRRSVRVG